MFVMYQNVLGGQPKIIFSKNCKEKKKGHYPEPKVASSDSLFWSDQQTKPPKIFNWQ